MTVVPMLADFAVRLAFGLAVSLMLTSWRAVPLVFFRTQAQVILGLLVLAGLDQARAGEPAWALAALVTAAVMAYLSAVTWGLGLPMFGTMTSLLVVLVTAAWLGAASQSDSAPPLGSGHREPALVGLPAGLDADGHAAGSSLPDGASHVDRTAQAGHRPHRCCSGGALRGWPRWGCGYPQQETFGTGPPHAATQTAMFVAARWGMGFAGTAIATFMTWKTAQIRSTQSATGILYIAMIFVLFGELTAMILTGRAGTMY